MIKHMITINYGIKILEPIKYWFENGKIHTKYCSIGYDKPMTKNQANEFAMQYKIILENNKNVPQQKTNK